MLFNYQSEDTALAEDFNTLWFASYFKSQTDFTGLTVKIILGYCRSF